jgi:hypothetical protein
MQNHGAKMRGRRRFPGFDRLEERDRCLQRGRQHGEAKCLRRSHCQVPGQFCERPDVFLSDDFRLPKRVKLTG